MTTTSPQVRMSSPQTVENWRYHHLCLCRQCQAYALITLGQSALSPDEFVRRAKRYTLTNEQHKRVDEVKLQLWNESVKGERVG